MAISLNDYIRNERGNYPPPLNADIAQRWAGRIVPAKLHLMGESGADSYLSRYGKGIGAPKCKAFAHCAEDEGYPEMALGFWKKAYSIEITGNFSVSSINSTVLAAYAKANATFDTPTPEKRLEAPMFPATMQPGVLVTMQPSDAIKPREYYVTNPNYYGQPKRDGNKLVVFASMGKVWYQSRQLKLNGAPTPEMDSAFIQVANKFGDFILEGEVYHVDVEGKEHMTSATCSARNIELGKGEVAPDTRFSSFGCLFHQTEITNKYAQVRFANEILQHLSAIANCFSVMPLAMSQGEKQALVDDQAANGREGEVWFLADLNYRPGKISSGKDKQYDGYVRTKYYLGIQKYRVLDVQPAHAEGHFIGGFSIEDMEGNAVGSVGTGYSREQQKQILARFTLNPSACYVLVDAQTKTVYGQLRHAAFKGFPEE